MDDDIDLLRLPEPEDGLEPIVDRVLRMPEHAHLVDHEIDVAWLFRVEPKVKGGREILGTVYEPTVQGELRDVFRWMLRRILGRLPHFIAVLDETYWGGASDRDREILCFHCLCHVRQKTDKYGAPRYDRDGLPVYGVMAHDVEEFTAVVERYGAWNDDIRAFVEAARAYE